MRSKEREIAMKFLRALAVGLMLAGQVSAQDFDKGLAAYKAGDYTRYIAQFVVGDTLDVSVNYRSGRGLGLLTFILNDTLRDTPHAYALFASDNMEYWDEGGLLSSTSSRRFGIERGDEITFEGGGNEKLILRRYYRDDWQGTFTELSGMSAQVAVLDCRVSGQNNLAEITDSLKAIVKKWDG